MDNGEARPFMWISGREAGEAHGNGDYPGKAACMDGSSFKHTPEGLAMGYESFGGGRNCRSCGDGNICNLCLFMGWGDDMNWFNSNCAWAALRYACETPTNEGTPVVSEVVEGRGG